MLYEVISHNITDGNIASTTIGSISPGGIPEVVGVIFPSAGADHTATVVVTISTPLADFVFTVNLFPSIPIPIFIPLMLGTGGGLSYSTVVTGTNGSYQIFLAVKD